MSDAVSGAELKKQLRAGQPKMGLFLNAHSPTVAEQLAHSGYDWLLVDTQHGPMDHEKLSTMLCAIGSGGGCHRRDGKGNGKHDETERAAAGNGSRDQSVP